MDIFKSPGTIFFVGIKGAAMANLAIILQKMGCKVAGSDSPEEFITDTILKENSIHVFESFESHVLPADTIALVYSAAHGGILNNLVLSAKEKAIMLLHQAELIAMIMSQFTQSIAVCGTHGKTTTSAFITYALSKLGAKPSYMVGTSSFSGMNGGDFGSKPYFVVEADEYAIDPPRDKRAKFLLFQPKVITATNIDFDHPDVYASIKETELIFDMFFRKIAEGDGSGKLILCADDVRLMNLAKNYPENKYETYGYSSGSDLKILSSLTDGQGSKFTLDYKGKRLGEYDIVLYGGGHIINSAAVVLTLLNLGYSSEDIRRAIGGFSGAKRRFELVKQMGNIYLFDDYAHHPSEMKATIATARARFPGRRIVLIFQPHTFSRTESLKKEFLDAFSKADVVFLSPIFASARENANKDSITSEKLAESTVNVKLFEKAEDLETLLKSELREGDVVFTMGAGDIYKMKDTIIKVMQEFNGKT